jgi:hypothetical protein
MWQTVDTKKKKLLSLGWRNLKERARLQDHTLDEKTTLK